MAMSLSSHVEKSCPVKPARLGKFIEPSTPLTFMSRMRSWMS
jgi:hypothetical protein